MPPLPDHFLLLLKESFDKYEVCHWVDSLSFSALMISPPLTSGPQGSEKSAGNRAEEFLLQNELSLSIAFSILFWISKV